MTAKGDNIKGGGFRVEVSLYYGYVVAMALRRWRALSARLKARIEMADLVQDGYVGLLEAAARFDPSRGCSFLTFAHHRIVGEMAQEKEKAAKLPAFLEEQGDLKNEKRPADALAGIADPAPSPREQAAARRLREDLLRAVAALPQDERALLRERFFERHTLQEIADRQGVAVATVFTRQWKALAKLRRALERKGYTVADIPDSPGSNWPTPGPNARERVSTHE